MDVIEDAGTDRVYRVWEGAGGKPQTCGHKSALGGYGPLNIFMKLLHSPNRVSTKVPLCLV